jgi:predicted chitinase
MKHVKSFHDLYENSAGSKDSPGKESFDKWMDSQIRAAIGTSIYPSQKSVKTSDTTSNLESPVSGQIILPGSGNKKKAMQEIISSLNRVGITNPYVQAGILGVVSNESDFSHVTPETSYRITPNVRIREVYGDRVKGLTDAQLDALKKDDVKFWDRVYGKDDPTGTAQKYGHTEPGDGWKYRGRGYNQLTWKSNYQRYTDLLKSIGSNVNLVTDPDILARDSQVAADVVALFFKDVLNNKKMKNKYGNKDHNDFKSLETATKAVSNANSGPGTNINTGIAGEGARKALAFARDLDLDNLQSLS